MSELTPVAALEKAMNPPTKKTASSTSKSAKSTTKVIAKDFIIIDNENPLKVSFEIINPNLKKFMLMNKSQLFINDWNYAINEVSKEDAEVFQSRCVFTLVELFSDAKRSGSYWFEPCEYTRAPNGIPEKAINIFREALAAKFELLSSYFESLGSDTGIAFELLPIALTNKLLFITLDGGVVQGIKATSVEHKSGWSGRYVYITGEVICHSGLGFCSARIDHKIYGYSGERTLKQLGVELPSNTDLFTKLIARGKKYVDLLKNNTASYLQCAGNVTRKTWFGPVVFSSTGRVMLDYLGMKKMDTNYRDYFGCDYDGELNSDDSGIGISDLTNEDYTRMAAYVYGFSFKAKVWGEFNIDDLADINFRTDSYDRLILDNEIKNILFSLVKSNEPGKDLIDNKGGGCIFLLHGQPGMGKTLTAETISETLQRPLYMVSVGELGTNVEALEESLRKILEIAASWNAVLLIDEVDIFLEKRDDLNVERNALVAVFLRLLEYYQGILFLTTNRVNEIDPAFYSRISLGIHYKGLDASARKQIWSTQLGLYAITISDQELNVLAEIEINGRQIKNCVRIVNSLTKNENKIPTLKDFQSVLHKVQEFNKLLEAK